MKYTLGLKHRKSTRQHAFAIIQDSEHAEQTGSESEDDEIYVREDEDYITHDEEDVMRFEHTGVFEPVQSYPFDIYDDYTNDYELSECVDVPDPANLPASDVTFGEYPSESYALGQSQSGSLEDVITVETVSQGPDFISIRTRHPHSS